VSGGALQGVADLPVGRFSLMISGCRSGADDQAVAGERVVQGGLEQLVDQLVRMCRVRALARNAEAYARRRGFGCGEIAESPIVKMRE
jgi:hypothetical protein